MASVEQSSYVSKLSYPVGIGRVGWTYSDMSVDTVQLIIA